MNFKKTTLKSFSSSRIQDIHIISSITMSALHPQAIYAGEAAYSTCTRPQEHFMISTTQHLNIYSSLKIYCSKTNAQRVYSTCGKVRWWVVAHYSHVQVSPAYLCLHTRPVHKQYTPAFHLCAATLPKQGHVPANSSYSTREQLIACIPLPSTHIQGRRQAPLNFYQDQITLMTTALMGMYLCS